MDKKAHGGNVGLKLDVTKAFDTMSWDFLLSVLGHFGFCETFLSWVKTILESARLSVLINGSPHGFFGCSRGVRQGDPLSPILFCIAEDFLSRGLAKLFSEKKISTITTPRNCSAPSHVLFSDDIFVFCRADARSLNNLNTFLGHYAAASGQIVNCNKSSFFLGSRSQHRKDAVASILNFSEGSLPFNYLGIPIFKGKPKREFLQQTKFCPSFRLGRGSFFLWREELN